MKKFLLIILSCLFIFGCMDMQAKNAVTDYLSKYNNLTDEVLNDLDKVSKEEDLTEDQEKVYKDIIKKQYQDLRYEVVNEKYNGDNAVITVKITVYDLYKAQKDASIYMKENTKEFYDENDIYSNKKYIDYKLEQMKMMNDKINYTIDFNVNKKGNKWIVEQLNKEDLEKIHGVYNYE